MEHNAEKIVLQDNFGDLWIIHVSPVLLAALFALGRQTDSAVGVQLVSVT
jgi:hypothetical protein